MEKGPLQGMVVIDASNVIAGPTAGKLLADYGATVIKIEHPRIGDAVREFGFKKDGVPLWWKVLNRNKKAVTLTLSTKEGQEIFKKMANKADVVIHNYRPGKMKEWGIDYDSLSESNEGLVMLEISGYGQTGPLRNKPGFGTIAEAMSGFSFVNGFPDKPPLMPTNTLADSITGIYGALSIMFAIRWRDSEYGKGKGQAIDLSLFEGLFSIMDSMVSDYDQLGIVQIRTGNMPENTHGPRNAYLSADGKWMALSANTLSTIERTLDLLGLTNDERLGNIDNIVENLPEIDNYIAEWAKKKTAQEIQDTFDKFGAVVAPVYSVEDIMTDSQYAAREAVINVKDNELGNLKMQGLVAKFSETPGAVNMAGQKLGESNHDVYVNWLGMTNDELDELHSRGVL